MTLSKVWFSDILRNDYLDQFDTFEENHFHTFKNDTFESVWVDRHPHDLGLFGALKLAYATLK